MKLSANPYASHKLLAAELKARGYEITESLENGHLIVSYGSPWGNSWVTPAAHIRYPFTSKAAQQFSVNKAAAYTYANQQGIPTPFTKELEVDDTLSSEEAQSLLNQYAPLIVKPNNSSLSQGLTRHIYDIETLENACLTARSIKQSTVLIQQQVSGDEIRFIIMKGRIVAALLRQTPRVVGDGIHTVEALIQRENEERKLLTFPYITYPLLTEQIIDKDFLTDQRVLADGEVLELSSASMIREGCSIYQVLNEIHQDYIAEIETFVEKFQADFLVADFLIQDYRQVPSQTNHWFLEFNASPVLKLCYGCRDGNMFDIVPRIADLIDEALHKR